MSYLEEIYQTCKVLAEHTGETELAPMIKNILAEVEALKQQVEQGKQGKQDAERYRWLSEYLIGARYDLDDAIIRCVTKVEMDAVIDAAAPKQEKCEMTETDTAFEDGHNSGLDYNASVITKLSAENATLKAKSAVLVDALESIKEYWNQDEKLSATVDACWHAVETSTEALAEFKGEK